MNSQTVNCDASSKEGAWIAFLISLILLFGWLLLPYNQVFNDTLQLEEHQISIDMLAPKQLTMVADLRLAHEEIRDIYLDTQRWVTVAQLAENWISPFVKDKSWIAQGEHQWVQVASGIYQGTPTTGSAHFLLISRKLQVELWLDNKGDVSLLELAPQKTQLLTNKLISSGWQQIVLQGEEDHLHKH